MEKRTTPKPIESLEYPDIEIIDIIEWCKNNNQVAWLKAKALEKVECKVYPRKKVITTVDGKEKVSSISDKSQEPKIEERPITFVQIKRDFVTKFFPDKFKGKKKEPTMYDLIAAL